MRSLPLALAALLVLGSFSSVAAAEPAPKLEVTARRLFQAHADSVITVRATAFARNFARYQDEAIEVGVIVVTSHDRVVGGYLSASELANYEKLKARERQALRVGELPDDVIRDIETAMYAAEPA